MINNDVHSLSKSFNMKLIKIKMRSYGIILYMAIYSKIRIIFINYYIYYLLFIKDIVFIIFN